VPSRLPTAPGSVELRAGGAIAHDPERCSGTVQGRPPQKPVASITESPIEPWGSDTRATAPAPSRETPITGDAVEPPPADDAARWWQPWIALSIDLWDDLRHLPPIPISVWLSGIIFIMLWHTASTLAFRRRLRAAQPAAPPVQRAVEQAAAALNLPRAPDVLIVDGCLSPMIWCGHRLQLILPRRLWDELDPAGRKAILYHELAHLRRRDHWVCWLTMLVGALYWWHPLAWWARRRLNEEADLCCDAWVTWLMPRRRRQYAEALLRTKAFIGERGRFVPAGGMGVTSVGAKRFARRLTMVMTGSSRPDMTMSGAVLVMAAALIGWMAVPGWAIADDPPKMEEKKLHKEVEILALVEEEPENPKLDSELRRLEHELEALARELAELRELAERVPRPSKPPRAPRSAAPPRTPRPAAPPRAATLPTPGMLEFLDGDVAKWYAASKSDEKIVRTYELPEGKLEALTKLMVRDDVPVLVSPQKNSIEVHGTAAQHRKFAAFVEMIHPTGKYPAAGTRTPWSQLGVTGVYRDALKAQTEARVKVEDALRKARTKGGCTTAPKASYSALQEFLRAGRYHGVESLDAQIQALNALIQQLNAESMAREQHGAAMEAQAEALAEQAQELNVQAEELADQAAQFSDEADETEDRSAARALQAQVRMLERQARELERQARMLERRADRTAEKAEEFDGDVDELDESVQQLQEALELLRSITQLVPRAATAPEPDEPR
jgi:beta-lactamase regulating signal transducer with metallopeptidase domain